MNFKNILAVIFIFLASAAAWVLLGTAVTVRTRDANVATSETVGGNWGPPLTQNHPYAAIIGEGGRRERATLLPVKSEILAKLYSDPKKKGLMQHRTYRYQFAATYLFRNPSSLPRTIAVTFELPSDKTLCSDFQFVLGDSKSSDKMPREGRVTEAAVVPPGGEITLRVEYKTRGLERWSYAFPKPERIRNFHLVALTDFLDYNIPSGSASATDRKQEGKGWNLAWDFSDVLSAPLISVEVPTILNPGPVAARIAFFAPVSLLFFFAVLLVLAAASGGRLHPMHYFFLAAGAFAFQLLFSYLVDLIPVHAAFAISGTVSVAMICGYLHAVTNGRLTRTALIAQLAYSVLFSYSFFFDGLTGLTITVGAIATLIILMIRTARVDWFAISGQPRQPQPANG